MRHALITAHLLLNQAPDAAVAQAEADERLEHQTQALPPTPAHRARPVRPGRHPGQPCPLHGGTDHLTAGCDRRQDAGRTQRRSWSPNPSYRPRRPRDQVAERGAPQTGRVWSFRWSFPEAAMSATKSHHLDGGPDLTSENATH